MTYSLLRMETRGPKRTKLSPGMELESLPNSIRATFSLLEKLPPELFAGIIDYYMESTFRLRQVRKTRSTDNLWFMNDIYAEPNFSLRTR